MPRKYKRKSQYQGRDPADVIAEFKRLISKHPDEEFARLAREIVEIAKRAPRPRPGAPPNFGRRRATELRHKDAALVGREIKRRLLEKDKTRRERLGTKAKRRAKTKDKLTAIQAHAKAAKIVARLLKYSEHPLSAETISEAMERPGGRWSFSFSFADVSLRELIDRHLVWRFFAVSVSARKKYENLGS
jgi:hypothetical protein